MTNRDQVNQKWPARSARRAGVSGSVYTQEAVLARMLADDWGCPQTQCPTRGHMAVVADPVLIWNAHQ
jgi:hypothetical protein